MQVASFCKLQNFFFFKYPYSMSMAPCSSTLAWKIPWTEKPGRLQSMGSRKVGRDWATSLSLFTFVHWRRQWQSCLENSRDCRAWWAAVYGVAQSWTRLKRLSNNSMSWLNTIHSLVTIKIKHAWYIHKFSNISHYEFLPLIFHPNSWATPKLSLSNFYNHN